MQKVIEELGNEIDGTVRTPDEESQFRQVAKKIAGIAIDGYKDKLYDKAMAIVKAIVEYDIELGPNNQPKGVI